MPATRRQFIGDLSAPGEGRPRNVTLTGTWRHNVIGWGARSADISAGKAVGANAPTWSTFRDSLSAYEFDDGTMNEVWVNFHMGHDYADGTLVYPNIHWATNTTSTGVVRWGFEYSVAKSHDQEVFPASTTIYVETTIASDKQYQHLISETDADSAFDAFEADSIILCRIFRDAAHANDTFPDPVHAFASDIEYQADKDYTPNRHPPFLA